ncbi:MAG: hypothetical protein Q9228_002379 [Teloschistes exilis]
MANVGDQFHLGQRLSCDGELGTVRYKGGVVGTKGPWLGVEWDNPHRGKNDGSHDGIRYFDCWIPTPMAASFVRPSRPFDQPQSLLDAVRAKYGNSVEPIDKASEDPIIIGGKQVNEVGFDKIAQKQSAWSELAIVSLDGLRINCLFPKTANSELPLNPFSMTSLNDLKWKGLYLANNLFERWADILQICHFARELKALRLSGNRLEKTSPAAKFPTGTCEQIERLDLANMALTWEDASLLSRTRVLSSAYYGLRFWLSAPKSIFLPFEYLTSPSMRHSLYKLSREASRTTCFDLPNLEALYLRSNPLTDLSVDRETKFRKVSMLSLASTSLPALTSLNPLPYHFPALKALSTTDTPLAVSHSNARLLTIARLPLLESLNHTIITRNERQDAELYYMHLITELLLGAKTIEESNQIRREHPVWDHLCDTHGDPESIIRKRRENGPALQPKYPPVSLGANLIRFIFVRLPSTKLPSPPSLAGMTTRTDSTSNFMCDLPRHIDIYHLKSFLGRSYSIPAMYVRLVLETNEWDPVPTTQLGGLDWGSSNDDDSDEFLDISGGWDRADDDNRMDIDPSASTKQEEISDPRATAEKLRRKQEREERRKKRWVKREVVIPDSTRGIGDWVEGDVARVRVEEMAGKSMADMGASDEALKLLEEEILMR